MLQSKPMKQYIHEVEWLPRKDAEAIVRERRVIGVNRLAPVAIGIHPEDGTRACLLYEHMNREPFPIFNGARTYHLDGDDFADFPAPGPRLS